MEGNKPYFAKYLPVEGEIKEGDKCLMYLGSNYLLPTIQTYDGVSHLGKEDKLMKFFLCSRDIQVGSKFTWGNIKTRIEDVVEHILKDGRIIDSSGTYHTIEDTFLEFDFKVIGEISPEATWVEEGDEFTFGKIDNNGYICPYNQEDEKYIEFWTERSFRNLPNI